MRRRIVKFSRKWPDCLLLTCSFSTTLPLFPFLIFSRLSSVFLLVCSSVSLLVCSLFFTFLCSFVLLSSSVSLLPFSEQSSLSCFSVSHLPLSVVYFLSYFFPLFPYFFPQHYSSLQSYSSVFLTSIRPRKNDGKQMPTSKRNWTITSTKYFPLAPEWRSHFNFMCLELFQYYGVVG